MVDSCNAQGIAHFDGLELACYMSIGDASIGPQGYGRSLDAVVCVHLRQTGGFADFVCESVYAK